MTGVNTNFRTRTLSRDGVMIKFGPMTFRLVTALLAARLEGIALTAKEMVECLYNGEDGGPDWAWQTPYILIGRMRHGQYRRRGRGRTYMPPHLWRLGLRIVTHGQRGYTIEIGEMPELREAAE